METMDRRTFVRRSALFGGGIALLGPLQALSAREAIGMPTRTAGYGPLVPKGDLALPAQFDYQVISRQGKPMSDGSLTPGIFDGMAAFRGREKRTTILIRNHENRRRPGEFPVIVPADKRYDLDPTYNGGNTKLVVRKRKVGRHRFVYEVKRDFAILGGTDTNCAGGIAGRSWVTCEEVVNRSSTGTKHGYVFEVPADAEGPVQAEPIRSAGRLVHEAALLSENMLYETEDRNIQTDPRLGLIGACFYRYVLDDDDDDDDDDDGNDDDRRLALAQTSGVLQALKLKGEFHANMDAGRVVGRPYPVEWVTVDVPDHDDDTDERRDRQPGSTPTRIQAQDKGAAFFDRQEGMWLDRKRGLIYFACTEGGALELGQLWAYDPEEEAITLVYESTSATDLQNPDNVVIVPRTGDVFLQEDSPDVQYVRGVTPDGRIYDFAHTITNHTEFCGGCFDPDGTTLYLNQQGERGGPPEGPPGENAVTYAIFGPFAGRSRHDDDDEED